MSFGWMKFHLKSYIYVISTSHTSYRLIPHICEEFYCKLVEMCWKTKIRKYLIPYFKIHIKAAENFLIFSSLIWSLQEAKHKVQSLQNWIPRQRVCDKYRERRLLTEKKSSMYFTISSKGQLILECPFDFPKKQRKNLTNFCPRIWKGIKS